MSGSAGPTAGYGDHVEARMVSRPPSRSHSVAARAAAVRAARAEDGEAFCETHYAATAPGSGPTKVVLADVVVEPA